MRFLYVDESLGNSHCTLVGISLSDLDWRIAFGKIVQLRRHIATQYGIKLRDEWHANEIWRNTGIVRDRHLTFGYPQRRAFFRDIAFAIRNCTQLEVFVVSMPLRKDVLEICWSRLIQRFENDLLARPEHGIIVADAGHEYTVRKIARRMMAFNPIPSQIKPGSSIHKPVVKIIEDPFFRDSAHSYFVQLADILTWLCRLRHDSTKQQRKWGMHRIFTALRPILKLQASRYDHYGFVMR
ncbi:MAG TPA: DUF3800 domain-containing protein [Acidobacteriota bacterium]|nr:DUF3800 domain-containing protein [Acidobacteriota bacterium]